MNQSERVPQLQEVARNAVASALQDVYTAAPVEILSYDPATRTATAKVLYWGRREIPKMQGWPAPAGAKAIEDNPGDDNSQFAWEELPVLNRCPVVFISGAGFTIYAPPKVGDEALAIFSARSIYEWFEFGGANRRDDTRTHSLSDAFILAGVTSKPNIRRQADTSALEISNDDGSIRIRLDATGVTIHAPKLTIEGDAHITGGLTVDNDATSQGVSLQHHVHTGVQPGGGTSGPPQKS